MKKIIAASAFLSLLLLVFVIGCKQVTQVDPPKTVYYNLNFEDPSNPGDLGSERSILEKMSFNLRLNVELVDAKELPKLYTWKAVDETIIQVEPNKSRPEEVKITGLKPGTTRLSVIASGEIRVEHAIIINVNPYVPLTGIEIEGPQWVDYTKDDGTVIATNFTLSPIPANANAADNIKKAQWKAYKDVNGNGKLDDSELGEVLASDLTPSIVDGKPVGMFVPSAPGDYIITASAPDGNPYGADKVKTLVAPPHAVKVVDADIVFPTVDDKNRGLLPVGGAMELGFTIVFNEGDESVVPETTIWSSKNPEVATVEEGKVTGVSSGVTTIYGEIPEYGLKFSAEIAVVDLFLAPGDNSKGLVPYDNDGTDEENKTSFLTITPQAKAGTEVMNQLESTITWTVDDASIVEVVSGGDAAEAQPISDQAIKVKALKTGKTLVTAVAPVSLANDSVVELKATYEVEVGVPALQNIAIVMVDGSEPQVESGGSLYINKDSSRSFKVKLSPAGSTAKNILWTVNDNKISIDGASNQEIVKIKGLTKGETKLSVTADGKTSSLNIKVVDGIIIEGLGEISRGGPIVELEALIGNLTNVDEANLRWSTKSAEIIFLSDRNGVSSAQVVVKNPGESNTRMMTRDSARNASDVAVIEVLDTKTDLKGVIELTIKDTYATSIVIEAPEDADGNAITQTVPDGIIKLTAVIGPNDPDNYSQATDRTATWTSLDPTIASVSSTGEVKGIKAGTVQIEASANGVKPGGPSRVKTQSITVYDFLLNRESAWVSDSLLGGGNVTVSSRIEPNLPGIRPSISEAISNDESLVEISASGRVIELTGKGSGSTTVDVTDEFTGLTRDVEVTVVSLNPIQGPSAVEGGKKAKYAVSPTSRPEGYSPSITWSVKAPEGETAVLATIDSGTGELTAGTTGGDVVVVAKDATGMERETTVSITHIAVTDVTISGPASVNVEAKVQLSATVLPEDAADSTVTWRSGDTAIATVDPATGEVTGVAQGSTKIYAKAGSVESSHTITVRDLEVSAGQNYVAKGNTIGVPLTGKILPEGEASMSWSSSPSGVVSIVNGEVFGSSVHDEAVTITGTDSVTGLSRTLDMLVVAVQVPAEQQKWVGKNRVELTSTMIPAAANSVVGTPSYTWAAESNAEKVELIVENGTTYIAAKENSLSSVTLRVTESNSKATTLYTMTVPAFKLSTNSVTLGVGQSATIVTSIDAGSLSLTPNVSFEFKAGTDTDVATLDGTTGKVTAAQPGTAVIVVSDSVTGQSVEYTVKVQKFGITAPDSRTWVGVNGANQTLKLSAGRTDTRNVRSTVTWSSDSPTVASVGESTGLVTGLSAGDVTITATEGGSNLSDTYAITVVGLNTTGATSMFTSGEITLSAALSSTPAGITPAYVWSQGSADSTIATITEDGTVSAKNKVGEVVFTVTETKTGLTATHKVAVNPVLPTTVEISGQTVIPLQSTDSIKLSATVQPDTVTVKTVTWESLTPNKASVHATSGVVTGLEEGRAIIQATANGSSADDPVTGEYEVFIVDLKIDGVDTTAMNYIANGTSIDVRSYIPDYETSISWGITGTSGAVEFSTTEGGEVQLSAKALGQVKITATDANTKATKSFDLTVVDYTLVGSPSKHWLAAKESLDLSVMVKAPSGSTFTIDSLDWAVVDGDGNSSNLVTLSNQSVEGATVTANNMAGEVTVTATHTSGLVATYTITVGTLKMKADQPTWVAVGSTETLEAELLPVDATVLPSPVYEWMLDNQADDTGKARVTKSTGSVYGETAGSIQVKVTETETGLAAIHEMTVVDFILTDGENTLENSVLALPVGAKAKVVGKIIPSYAPVSADISYSVSYSDEASPAISFNEATGEIVGLTSGSAVITLTDAATGIEKTYTVNVQGLEITAAGDRTWVGVNGASQTLKLTAGRPAARQGRTLGAISWESMNPALATVDATSGVVTGVSASRAGEPVEVVATEAGTGLKASYYVSVIAINASAEKTSMNSTDENQLTIELSTVPTGITPTFTVTTDAANTTVDQDNLLTTDRATAESVTVTVTETGGTGLSEKIVVSITEIKPTKVEITTEANTVPLNGASVTLEAVVTPETAINKKVTWKSSSEEVATVDAETGLVTPKKIGSTTITATAVGGDQVTATKEMWVVDFDFINTYPNMTPGQEMSVTAKIIPTQAGVTSDIEWSSGNPEVVSIGAPATGETVTLKAHKLGNDVVITAYDKVTKTERTFTITVVNYTLEEETNKAVLPVESEMTLTPKVTPSDSGFVFKDLIWTVENTDGTPNSRVLEIVSRGDSGAKVKGKANGTVVVKAKHPLSNLVAEYTVTVAELRMKADQPAWVSVGTANKKTLEAELLPEGVLELMADPRYTWALDSAYTQVGAAEVGATTGEVTGTSSGAIQVKVTEGVTGLSVTYEMTIADFALTGDLPAFLAIGSETTIGGEISPADLGLTKALTFSSDKPEFATVDETSGLVTAIAPGTVTITGTEATTNIEKTHKIEILGFGITAPERDWFINGNNLDISAKIEGTLPGGLTPKINWTVKPDSDKPVSEQGSATPATAEGTTLQLTGATPGAIVVTATEENTGLSDSYALTVVEPRITNKPEGDWISAGSSHTLGVEIYPANIVTPAPTMSWSVSESTPVESGATVASIDASTGELTGSAAGTVTILVKDSVFGFEDTYTMSVLDTFLADSNVTWIVNETSTTPQMKVLPEGVISPSYSWSITSSTPEYEGETVADLNQASGKVDGKSPGTITVTIEEAVTGRSKTQDITVVDFILAPLENIWIEKNATKQLTPILQPTGFSDPTFPGLDITWSVTQGTAASVNSSTGVVTSGNTLGQVMVTAKDAVINIERSHSLVVGELVVSGRAWIRRDPYPEDITVTLLPAGFDTPTVTWSTQDAEHASRVNLPAGEVVGSGNSAVSAITGNTYDVETIITLVAEDSISGFTATHPIRVAPEPMIMTYTGTANRDVYLPVTMTSANPGANGLMGIPGEYGVVGQSVDPIYKGGVTRKIDLMVSWDYGETWKHVTSSNSGTSPGIIHRMTGSRVDVWISSHNDEIDMSPLSLMNGAYVTSNVTNRPRNTITDVKQWGDSLFENVGGTFAYATKLTGFSATDAPRLKGSLYAMFFNNKNFTGRGVEHWDMSEVTETMQMFAADNGGSKFNADLGSWDVSNVVNMQSMFDGDYGGSGSFEGKGLENWRPHSLKYASGFVRWQSRFSPDLSNWFTNSSGGSVKSKLVDMEGMFQTTNLRGRDFSSWDLTGNNTRRRFAFSGSGVSREPKY